MSEMRSRNGNYEISRLARLQQRTVKRATLKAGFAGIFQFNATFYREILSAQSVDEIEPRRFRIQDGKLLRAPSIDSKKTSNLTKRVARLLGLVNRLSHILIQWIRLFSEKN